MKPSIVAWAVLILAGSLGAAPLVVAAEPPPRELEWDELMPKGWDPFAKLREFTDGQPAKLMDGSAEAGRLLREYRRAGRSSPIVAALDGQRVRLPGFVVPLDFSGATISEFLLVPYFGACIHVPPPPSNQIVYVKSPHPYETSDISDPVWVTGTIRAKMFANDVGDAGYTIEATLVEPFR